MVHCNAIASINVKSLFHKKMFALWNGDRLLQTAKLH